MSKRQPKDNESEKMPDFDDPEDEAPVTPTDEPPPVPVRDPPVDARPKPPLTVGAVVRVNSPTQRSSVPSWHYAC
jgi:hypothetical protein